MSAEPTPCSPWLRIYRLPAYAPDLNPAEGIWSLLKRAIASFAAADVGGMVRIVNRKPKQILWRTSSSTAAAPRPA